MRHWMGNNWTRGVWLLTGMILGVSIPALAQERVVVYTTFEQDEIPGYLAAAQKDMPDLVVMFLRLSVGELAARVPAEKENPQTDVIWGQATFKRLPPKVPGRFLRPSFGLTLRPCLHHAPMVLGGSSDLPRPPDTLGAA